MNTPIISAIAAIGENTRALGKDNDLLWRIPDDHKRLKKITMGHPLIMGRKTWESIPEKYRPLPGRTNIVLTRNEKYSAPGAILAHSLKDALDRAREEDNEEIFIFGGEKIYTQALPQTQRLYLMLVDSDKEGDTFFPDYSEFTKETFRKEGEHEGIKYTWVNLERE
ncbi:MAG: dihydrofolate reductase [Candidatus Paceibacterota bacterium]